VEKPEPVELLFPTDSEATTLAVDDLKESAAVRLGLQDKVVLTDAVKHSRDTSTTVVVDNNQTSTSKLPKNWLCMWDKRLSRGARLRRQSKLWSCRI
jgi:hypothetical protein